MMNSLVNMRFLHLVVDVNCFKFKTFFVVDFFIQFFGKSPETSISIEEQIYFLTGVILNYCIWEHHKALLRESDILSSFVSNISVLALL